MLLYWIQLRAEFPYLSSLCLNIKIHKDSFAELIVMNMFEYVYVMNNNHLPLRPSVLCLQNALEEPHLCV